MKKIILSIIAVVVIVPKAYAFNALKDHNYYRNELSALSKKQHVENQRQMLYYKGPANYTVTQMRSSSSPTGSANKKDIYAKKGVTFKVDELKQEQRLREAKESVQEINQQKSSQKSELKENPPATSNSKVGFNKERSDYNTNARNNNVTEKNGLNLHKINVNAVKNIVNSAGKKQILKQEAPKVISNGKNADAE